MNVRANIVATATRPVLGSPVEGPVRLPSLAEAGIAPLSPGLSALFFDDGGLPRTRARLTCSLDGRALAPPFAATSLELFSGGRRHVLLIGRSASSLLDRHILLSLDHRPAASVDPNWLQPPLGETPALLEGLTASARRRLLKLLLTTGASLFGERGAADLAEAARRLLRLCRAEVIEPVACAAFGRAHRILTYRLPRSLGRDGVLDAIALWPAQAVQAKRIGQVREVARGGELLHLHLPQSLPTGAELIVLEDPPIRLLGAPDGLRAQPLTSWLEGRGTGVRDWAFDRVGAAAPADPGADALLTELKAGGPLPELAVRHLSATATGVVYALDLFDPHRLIRAVRIERNGQPADVEPRLRVDGGGTFAGVVPLRGQAREGEPCRLHLVHHSGRLRSLPAVPLSCYDGGVPPGFEAASAEAAAAGRSGPALELARARMALTRPPLRAQVQSFGAAPARVGLSLVTSLGDDPGAIGARAALLFREKGAGDVEVVCVATEGAAAAAGRRLLAGAVAVFGIPHRIVAVEEGASPAERFRAGIAHAQGAAVLALGSDVLPAQEGWLAAWRRRLARDPGPLLVPGTVRRPDGSAEEAVSVLADCAGLTRAAADRVLGSALSQPDPMLLLVELGLAGSKADPARAAGARYAFVRYGPAPCETPFEGAVRACALGLLAERDALEEDAP